MSGGWIGCVFLILCVLFSGGGDGRDGEGGEGGLRGRTGEVDWWT